MGKVTCFDVPGIQMWIYSGDHNPPHFHARKRGEWKVRVFFQETECEMIEIEDQWDIKISKKDRKAIQEGVKKYRAELLVLWEQCQGLNG